MERGVRFFLPGPTAAEMASFLEVLELLRSIGYDFIILELGGAMEYRRHPEINDGWLKYTAFMNEFPGKTHIIQCSQAWEKDSINTDNGHGGVVSQEQIAEIVRVCASIGLEIIPQVQTLSHADYILLGHPELAERPDDPWPDTCCPNHPGFYPLIEDILDEVIGLFHPKRIDLGHDECYTLGKCPRCREKSAPELYATEINRLAGWLRTRGIGTMMWAEKVLDAHFNNGCPIGGAAIPATAHYEAREALYPCGELIDKRVQMLHWYWSINRDYDRRFEELGVDFWFGNFSAEEMPELGRRIASPHCRGFVVSNWGANDLKTMQRNGLLYSIFYSALATDGRHDPDDFETLDRMTREQLHALLYAKGECVEIIHTTHSSQKFRYFYDGYYLQEEFYRMGDHIFADEEGNRYRFPVIFGGNISNDDVEPGRRCRDAEHYDALSLDPLLREVTGAAIPMRQPDGRVFYRTAWPTPCPGKRLSYVRFEAASAFVPKVEVLGKPATVERSNTALFFAEG